MQQACFHDAAAAPRHNFPSRICRHNLQPPLIHLSYAEPSCTLLLRGLAWIASQGRLGPIQDGGTDVRGLLIMYEWHLPL